MRGRTVSSETLQRFYAVLALRGLTLAAMARRCQVSNAHLRAVIMGERKPSDRLAATVQADLGPQAWAFIQGQCDVLCLERGHAA